MILDFFQPLFLNFIYGSVLCLCISLLMNKIFIKGLFQSQEVTISVILLDMQKKWHWLLLHSVLSSIANAVFMSRAFLILFLYTCSLDFSKIKPLFKSRTQFRVTLASMLYAVFVVYWKEELFLENKCCFLKRRVVSCFTLILSYSLFEAATFDLMLDIPVGLCFTSPVYSSIVLLFFQEIDLALVCNHRITQVGRSLKAGSALSSDEVA